MLAVPLHSCLAESVSSVKVHYISETHQSPSQCAEHRIWWLVYKNALHNWRDISLSSTSNTVFFFLLNELLGRSQAAIAYNKLDGDFYRQAPKLIHMISYNILFKN